jgi:UDP-glucose 4-epimerase
MPSAEPSTFLITGGAGFIGSHLTDALIAGGHRVLAIDNLSTGRVDNIKHLLDNPHYHFARTDINDRVVMDRMASQADVIVHLAAAVGVQLVVEHPVHTIKNNVMGTEAVLDSALRYGCRTLVASTSEVYGKGSKIPFSEDDDVLLGSTSKSRWGYAASKMVDEFLALAYHREYDLDVLTIRLFNTVGPRQTGRYGMVIPRFVRQALQGETITVYGDGSQSRCFCAVQDVVQGITKLAKSTAISAQVFNLGSTEEVTIGQLAERVKALTSSSSEIKLIPYEKAYAPGFEDMQRRVPDLTRISGAVGWQPQRSLDDILSDVITYEKATFQQI